MASTRPVRLVFDIPVETNREYEIEVVDAVGNQVLKRHAEVRESGLAALIEKLARGSYWVRVYREQPSRELLAEFSLRSE